MKSFRWSMLLLMSVFFCGLIFQVSASAQNILSSQPSRQIFLSLDEAISIALQNNLEIQMKQYDPEIKNEDIRRAEAAFGTSVGASGNQKFNEAPSPSQSPEMITGLGAEISKKFSSGGNIKLSLSTSRSGLGDTPPGTPDTRYDTALKLSVDQPLMKGRGADVNKTQVYIAQKQRESSVSELRAKTIDVVSKVKNTYWRLIYVRGDLEAKRLSLQWAYDLVKINEAQVKVGTLAPIEVLQAQAQAASREVQIISAEQTVRDVEDSLKQFLNIPEDDPVWDAAVIPTDSPVAIRQAISLDESIRMALENSEQLQQLQKGIEIQGLSLKASQNQLLPFVSISGSFEMTGQDEDLGGSMSELVGFDRYSFSVGANFSYPLGNVAAQSAVNKAKLELDKTRLSVRNAEHLIVMQVKQAIRSVETSYRLVGASQVALQLAEEQLDAEQKKFNEGLSTNFQVLQYQESLAKARSSYTQAITGYNQSLAGLDQVTGMTLERHNIIVE